MPQIKKILQNNKISNIFNSMHSSKDSSMSFYMTDRLTDFGSGWKGLTSIIKNLTDYKNIGLSSIIKSGMTAFGPNGVDLGKTMIKIPKMKKHLIKNIKDITNNVVLDSHKNRINHMLMR